MSRGRWWRCVSPWDRRASWLVRSRATPPSSAILLTRSRSSSARSCSRRAARFRAGWRGRGGNHRGERRGLVGRGDSVRRHTVFNVTTFQAMHTAVTSSEYSKLVWRPDWRGSSCFLVSGAVAYRGSPRHGGDPHAGRRMLAAAGRPAGLKLLWHRRGRRLRCSLDRLGSGLGGRELEHIAGSHVLRGLRARHFQ
jgi:hypothetical protein